MTRVEFACRFYYPDDNGQWRWWRRSQELWVDLPTQPGHSFTVQLPAPMFSWSTAEHWLLVLDNFNGRVTVRLDGNGQPCIRPVDWRTTALWTQHTFDPMVWGSTNYRGPWWLRYRCPDAPNDLWAKTYDYLTTVDDPAARQLRREITLHMLNGAMPI